MASALAVCLATATSLIEIKTHLGSTRERSKLRGNPDGEPDELAEIYVRRGLDADLATIAISTFGASAAIVCQGNVCRHTHEAHDFPHEAGVVVHENNWHWGPHEKFRFREHEGRYWHGGKWLGW